MRSKRFQIEEEDLHPDRIYSNLDWSDIRTSDELSRLARLGFWANKYGEKIVKGLRDQGCTDAMIELPEPIHH